VLCSLRRARPVSIGRVSVHEEIECDFIALSNLLNKVGLPALTKVIHYISDLSVLLLSNSDYSAVIVSEKLKLSLDYLKLWGLNDYFTIP
jgi:hypothetical protein